LFGAGYFSKSHFGGGYFGPPTIGGTPWGVPEGRTDVVEIEKESNTLIVEKAILGQVPEYNKTEELLEKALRDETLKRELAEEQEIETILLLIAHEL